MQLELSAYLVLAVFEPFVVYGSMVTGKSHGYKKSSQISHKVFIYVCIFWRTGNDDKRNICEFEVKSPVEDTGLKAVGFPVF